MMNCWNVYRPSINGTNFWIDTVFFTTDCDVDYVRNSLINHDGLPSDIIVELN